MLCALQRLSNELQIKKVSFEAGVVQTEGVKTKGGFQNQSSFQSLNDNDFAFQTTPLRFLLT